MDDKRPRREWREPGGAADTLHAGWCLLEGCALSGGFFWLLLAGACLLLTALF